MDAKLLLGDCLEVLKTIETESVDSIVTDPPAGIGFMGKDWDHDKGGRDAWIAWMSKVASECLRVLKPGGHAVVWALPRTSHWTATAWEDAGFEVRDRISHIFGSGFPKSRDVSKMIDKEAGATRAVKGVRKLRGNGKTMKGGNYHQPQGDSDAEVKSETWEITEPATEDAKKWEGWGTALKPAVEDWWLFRKPIGEKTIAANVLKWGTGALNIDASRIELNGEIVPINRLEEWSGFGQLEQPDYVQDINDKGRWPAHLIHDGSEEVVSRFPDSEGQLAPSRGDGAAQNNQIYGARKYPDFSYMPRGDDGSAARFFYCAKPSQEERNEGLQGVEPKDPASITDHRPTKKTNPENWAYTDSPYGRTAARKNNHPTVKPQALMRYLIRLVNPPGGVVLDPFMGSGSTGVAAMWWELPFIGIDSDEGYMAIAARRIKHAQRQPRLL